MIKGENHHNSLLLSNFSKFWSKWDQGFCTPQFLTPIFSFLLTLFIGVPTLHSQVQPFSRSDSVFVKKHTEDYQIAMDASKFREAAHHVNEVAFLHWEHNNYREAIKNYEISIGLNRKVANENGIAMIANNLGMLHADVKEYEKSLEYFNTTLATRRANKEKMGIVSALINMSVVQNNLGQYSDAITGLEEALGISREMNDISLMRSCYGNLSESYMKAGDNEKSLYFFDFYRSFHELDQKQKIENVEVALEEERGKKEALANEKLDLSERLDSRIGEIDKLKTDIAKADSVLNQLNNKVRTQDLQLKYASQEKELMTLREVHREEQAIRAARRRNYVYIVFSLALGSLAVISALIFFNRKRVSQKNRLLTERNSEIIKINNELKQANKIKNHLFSIIGHDLRSPLAQLEQTFPMLNQDMLDKSERDIVLNGIRQNLKQASLLLENLLAWARNQIQGQKAQLKPLTLNKVVDEAVYVMESVYLAKDIKVDRHYTYQGMVNTDEDMLKLVVRNIFSNAVKFSPRGATIKITTGLEDKEFFIEIMDKGVGMAPEQTAGLFDENKHQSHYGTENEKGMGIGLKLSKQYLDTLNGRINVNSELGSGTTFRIQLPG